MATYYIATNGSDSRTTAQAQNINTPWQTLSYACSQVSGVGDIIRITAGNYAAETVQCTVAVGVSIVGEGVNNTFILSNYAPERSDNVSPNAAIALTSLVENTNGGNQSISNFTLSGNGEIGTIGITVWRRSYVSIHHMNIIDFYAQGVSIEGFTDPLVLTTRATNIQFYSNTVTNCGDAADITFAQGGGMLQIGGTTGLLIYNNVFTHNTRTIGHCGDIIQCHPFHQGTKVYNNYFYKRDDEGGAWNFIIEAWSTSGGFEIYNNEFYGGECVIDCGAKNELGVGNTKGSYNYSFYIHNNLFTTASGTNPITGTGTGKAIIDIEGVVNSDIWIYYNHIKYHPTFILCDNGTSYNYTVTNIYVCYNIQELLGWSDNTYAEFNTFNNDRALSTVTNVYWYNNVLIGNGITRSTGLRIYNEGTITNFNIKNSIFTDCYNNGFLNISNSNTFDGLYIDYDILYNNSVDEPVISGSITNYSYTNYLYTQPPFASSTNFHLTAARNGIDVGLLLDYAGNDVANPPTIGVYEYTSNGTTLPTVTTTAITNITTTTASSGGNVTSDGGTLVTVRGVCWSTSSNPTTLNNITVNNAGTGSFTSSITGLIPNTLYHVRAYAINNIGTSYGSDVQFTTSSSPSGNIWYVSPVGNDSNSGTIGSPWLTLTHALSRTLNGGDTIYMRGGNYYYGTVGTTINGINGSYNNYINIWAYPDDEDPVIIDYNGYTFYNQCLGIHIQNSSYLYFKKIRVTGITQPTDQPGYNVTQYGLILWDYVSFCRFEQMEIDHIGGWGVHISDYSNYNYFLNCDSHHNSDRYSYNDPWGGADGFQSNSWDETYEGQGSTGNIFEGCRGYWNSDDGWDLRRCSGFWTIKNCWSFWNGYQPGQRVGDADEFIGRGNGEGFKAAGNFGPSTTEVRRFLYNNLAFENRGTAFGGWADDPGGYLHWVGMHLYNNVAYNNGFTHEYPTYGGVGFGFSDPDGPSTTELINNISYANYLGNYWPPSSPYWFVHENNSWEVASVSDSDFMSVITTGMDGPRQADGSLPVLNFFKLSPTATDLIATGIHIDTQELPFDGAGNAWNNPPSIGAYQYGVIGTLIINGETYISSDYGSVTLEDIPRTSPLYLTFTNNSMTAVMSDGYYLLAGEEGTNANINHLNGAIITGNKLIWNSSGANTIHGIMVGYNINDIIRYNYIDKVPYGVVFKSGTDAESNMAYTTGGLAYNIFKNCDDIAVRVKGMNDIPIYNNVFYDSMDFTNAFIYISSNSLEGDLPSTGTLIKNNIFYTTTGKAMIYADTVGNLSGLQCDYNIYYDETGDPIFYVGATAHTFTQWQALGYDTHSYVINPNFINTNDFIPTVRLDYGTNLGTTWQNGLSTSAVWTLGVSPAITNQNGNWQVGARVYSAAGIIFVTGITIAGFGGASTITVDNGTLQMVETVLPANATNKNVNWSILSGETYGSIISFSGLLTAINNGNVTVKATASDGTGIYGTTVIVISNQNKTYLLNSLIVYYKLDETTGINLSDAHGIYPAILSGGAVVNATGIINKCVNFTSSSGCITLPSGCITPAKFTDKFSISLWINPDTLTNEFYFFNIKNLSGQQRIYANFVPGDGTIYFACLPTLPVWNEYSTTSTSNVSTGIWQHFVFVCEGIGGGIKIYKNAVDITNNTFTLVTSFDSSIGSNDDSILNKNYSNTLAIDGRGDEIGIWNRALTIEEITQLYNSDNGLSYSFGEIVGNDLTLLNVCALVLPSSNTLLECFAHAIYNLFDPIYVGVRNRLTNFRNYGFWHYNDYYLPSKNEFTEIYNELYLHNVGNIADNTAYWSSSEYDANNAWGFVTGTGTGVWGTGPKYQWVNVRACRLFVSTHNYNLRDIGPAGGYIFIIAGSGYYFEAAPADILLKPWSTVINVLAGATETAIGTGLYDTTTIIAQHGINGNSAAKACTELLV